MTKLLMNEPQNIINEMLEGMIFSNPEISLDIDERVIFRTQKENKVGLVSAGGSGHEPAHAGFVGEGMLDAAVAGNVFSSPSPMQMLSGIRHANSGKGVLMILKNYSGDLMNFRLAKQMAEAEGIVVDSVIVKDDVAVPDSTYSTGRRGIAGTILVHKIAGAAAKKGYSLEKVKEVAQKTIDSVRSMGMSMSACTIPGLENPGFSVGEGIEIGMGIHGEPGVEKTSLKTSSEIAKILFGRIMDDYDYSGKEVAVLVNGLGATPLMELYVFANDISRLLDESEIKPTLVLVGNYMTSLNMAGCSLSILEVDDELRELLKTPCKTLGLNL
ncbi:dihydroxyacetone kinase subunit DhaK [Intestinimonas massiliensis]|uniref:Dihydroxyacetone kinase subunit DhaK n=1 Tax=Intestinimonas massiliensis (ex Afouda et al. 2020) TaxID=1673721 RepID=A0ABS9MDX9_9FIRM|nr:dihydroxyacetone kinase subunit DhaK [Intestinimonas massiliensis (ex Afouda et al. 2020)]MCG4529032.1 dihydroxyacetone kinase subunit DhaK [Intestinimonas massiliensis (ex Afouda et al. 2020)]MCQ4808031.1 dihydroxyacetone kinase subunit DhaK [Intestinimonas massiliensis (ex Afouda et al. 2020)]